MPIRDPDLQYVYTPDGWATTVNGVANPSALIGITEDRKVYAAYTKTTRTYDIQFVRRDADGGGVIWTQYAVPYGTKPAYRGPNPTFGLENATPSYTFSSWTPTIAAVNGTNTIYKANFTAAKNVVDKTDTWEEILESIEDCTYKVKYRVGNTFTLMYAGSNIRGMIADFEKDYDSNGVEAPITITPQRVVGTAYQQKATNAATWPRPNNANIANLPEIVRNNILTVRKRSNCGNSWDSVKTRDDYWKIWLLSGTELYGAGNYASVAHWNETPYANKYQLYDTMSSRIKYSTAGATIKYDTRSLPYVPANYGGGRCNLYVNTNGEVTGNRYNYGTVNVYTAFGFCLGTYYQLHYVNKTLSNLQTSINAGTYKTNFAIGNILNFKIDGKIYGAQIIAFDTTDISNGGKAAVTLLTYYTNEITMSQNDTSNYLNELYNKISNSEKELIVNTSNGKLWLPTSDQITIQPRRKSKRPSFTKYWLRNGGQYVNENGEIGNDSSITAGCIFGFCIGAIN